MHSAVMTSPTPEARDDFRAVADAQSKTLTRTICLAGAVMTLALAPYDLALAGHDARMARTLATMRVALLAIYALYFATYRVVTRLGRGVRFLQVPALLSGVVFGYAVGQLAHDDNYWLTTLYMYPVMCGVVLMRLPERLLNAGLFTLTPLVGFALSFDGALSEAHVVHAVGLFVMAASFGVYAGNSFYVLFREAFELRRSLDEKRTELADANAHLEARVDAQTRDLRHLATRLDDVLETERRRLARELHDDLGQELTAMRLEVEALRAVTRDDAAASRVLRVASSIERSHNAVRLILESLRPRILDEEGVEASVHWLALQFRERTGRACEARVTLAEEPDAQVGLAVFRIVQEALTNVARHADATRVEVTLRGDAAALTLRVVDDGRGLAEQGSVGRHGLIGMRERALAVGGTLDVTTADPSGTRVEAVLPMSAPEPAAGDDLR